MKRSPELSAFMKANKTARERRAVKAGFKSADEYRAYLEGKTIAPAKEGGTKSKKASASKPSLTAVSIHVVDILDRSGSMSGEKIKRAAEGINKNLDTLKKGEEGVNFTYTICEFSDYRMVNVSDPKDPSQVKRINTSTFGSTALFDAIGKTVKHIAPYVKPGEKVLINIYTDGQENDSRVYSDKDISKMIEEYSLTGYTFTFIGTSRDVEYVNKKLKIDVSNSLVYDGSAKGLEESIQATASARTAYVSNVKAGNDVSKGFYKNIQKK